MPEGMAPKERSRSAGVLWIVGLRFIIIFLQLINLLVAIHVLGDVVYGIAVFVAGVRALWQFVDLDIPQGLIQILSKTIRVDEDKAWRYFRAGLFLQFLVGVIGAVGVSLGAIYFGHDSRLAGYSFVTSLFVIAGIQFFFDSYGSTYNAPFNAREEFHKVAALTSGIPLFTVFIQIVLVLLMKSPIGILLGTLLDSVLQFIIKVYYIVKHEKKFPVLPKFDFECCRDIIHMGLKSYIAGLSTRIGGTVDKLIVGDVLGFGALTIYNLACRIPQILLEAFGKITESVTPEMTHVSANEPHRLAKIFLRNFKFIGFVAAVGIIFVSGFGDVILRAWMSRTYDGFGVLVFLMGIYYGLELHHSTITRVFFAQGKPQLMLPFTLWNSIITVCATKYLALRFGLLGAASMNCFIDVAQIIPIHYYCSRYGVKELTLSTLLKITVSILGIGTIAGLAVLLAFHNVSLGRGSYALVFAIPIFCVLLGAVYNRLGLIDLPNGIRKMLLKVSFLAKLYGVSGLVPEI